MKNFSLTTFKALHLAAFASLALLAMVSSAHAGGGTMTSHTVVLRTGNDITQNPLNTPGANDGNIRTLDLGLQSSWGLLNPQDFTDAAIGPFAQVVQANTGWDPNGNFSCPDARWIHNNHDAGSWNGTGAPDVSVLYAHAFELPANMPNDTMVTLNIEFLADNHLQGLYLGSPSFPNQLLNGPVGDFTTPTLQVFGPVLASSLGLTSGQNTLFFHQQTTSHNNKAGIKYCIEVTVEYCTLEIDLRSGDGFTIGSDDTNVRARSLSDGYGALELDVAFDLLDPFTTHGGVPPKVVDAIGGWTMLSDTDAQWINSHVSSSGFGNPHKCVLYAHDFILPFGLDPSAIVTLDVEWAADDELIDVYVNDQSHPMGITSGSPDYLNAHTDSITSTVSGLGLVGGLNALFFEQEDVGNHYSGVIYSVKLTVVVDCDLPFEIFCECAESVAPCGNVGGPNEGCANSTGAGARLTASGTTSNITLKADHLPSSTIGIFFGGSSMFGPLPFGDGLRCVGGNRFPVVMTNTGQVQYSPVPSGGKYQFWYRDNAGPCMTGFNLSNAVAIP